MGRTDDMNALKTHGMQDKRTRRAVVKKAALSSRISVLSDFTASSGGSSGSGSTITQESASRLQGRNAKDNSGYSKSKRHRSYVSHLSSPGRDVPRRSNRQIDVFAFLATDQSRASLVEPGAKQDSSPQDDPRAFTYDDSDIDSNPQSLHSDSGISINDAKSDQGSWQLAEESGQGPMRRVGEQSASAQHRVPPTGTRRQPYLQPTAQDLDDDERTTWYARLRNGPSDFGITSPDSKIGVAADSEQRKDASGYDLLASRLGIREGPGHCSLPPLYRRFERLNHRILLQLQDEIVEMEGDLQRLDQLDAQHRVGWHGESIPSSRRIDCQSGGGELYARRLELLGRIYLKIEQYNQAISSFQRVAMSTTQAPPEDIETYRGWMGVYKPVADAEAMYLDREDDLISLRQGCREPRVQPIPVNQIAALMAVIAPMTVMPILVLRVLPTFASRIALVLLLSIPVAIFILKVGRFIAPLNGFDSRHILFGYVCTWILAALVI